MACGFYSVGLTTETKNKKDIDKRVFNTTMGSSTDFLSEGLRRLIIQGIFWACGLEKSIPDQGIRADLVPPYDPTDFGFRTDEDWANKDLQPADFSKP